MNIAQKIEEIVKQRWASLPHVEQMQRQLECVGDVVQRLDMACEEARAEKGAGFGGLFRQCPEVREALQLIHTEKFHDGYTKIEEKLRLLKGRFSREQVHISFVGRAGQGKSLVMQKISGLTGEVIPSADGGDCTGAKSIITNREGDEVFAEIQFYSRMEYVDIVNKYLREIFGDDRYEVGDVEDIFRLRQKGLGSQLDRTSAKKGALYRNLEKYIEHSEDVVPFLGKTLTVPREEIESYVAQCHHADKTQKNYKYLGIKLANIMCRFPYEECGKTVLVDTIGLGDTAMDIREKMLETVSSDSDIILLMTRPDSNRQHVEQDDINIIEDISDKVGAEYTQRMLFWVINRVVSGKGENAGGIQEVLDELKKAAYPVAACLDVNCMDDLEVKERLLIPVLEKISENLPVMDKILIREAEKQMEELYKVFHDIAGRAGKAFKASVNSDMRREFDGLIAESCSRMSNSIRDLYLGEPYGGMRGQPCKELEEAVQEKLRHIFQWIPEKEDVLTLLNNGTINQHNAYEKLTDQIRLHIINDFLEVNDTLARLVEEMKQHILFCLADKTEGKLANLVPVQDKDADTWLGELVSYLESNEDDMLIVEALRKLIDFNLRMESFLIYRVRAHLDVIDISLLEQPPQIKFFEKEKMAEDIIFWLGHNLEIVHKRIYDDLKPLYSYPNNALWAAVKDFYDRIVYAKDCNTGRNVQTSWRYLYEDSIPLIWPEECRSYQMTKGVVEEWNALVKEIHKYDNRETFCFGMREVQ